MKSNIIELTKLFIIANICVFFIFFTWGMINYVSSKSRPLYYIRTNDGVYFSSYFKHYGDSVSFLYNNEIIKKSQNGLSGIVVQRIR